MTASAPVKNSYISQENISSGGIIFQQFSRRDVKLVAFLIIFHLLNYTSRLIPKLYGKMKQKLAYYEVESTPKKNVYVNELNIVLLYLLWRIQI